MSRVWRWVAPLAALAALSAGCALQTEATGTGSGALGGEGQEFGAADGGVDPGSTETTAPESSGTDTIGTSTTSTETTGTNTTTVDPLVPSTTEPSTSTALSPVSGTETVIEPACTPATERSTCPGTSCDPMTLTCTNMQLSSRGTCETCFADTNCADSNHRCVWMTHQGEPFPDERLGFCLPLVEPVIDVASDACPSPFSVLLTNRESPSGGKLQPYCGIQEKLTTCFAVLAFHNRELCPSGRDEECPEGGVCRPLSANGNKTEFACTYACTEDAECSNAVTKVTCSGYCDR